MDVMDGMRDRWMCGMDEVCVCVRARACVCVTEEMKSTPMAAEMTYLALLLSYRCAAVSCVQSRANRINSPAQSEGPCAQVSPACSSKIPREPRERRPRRTCARVMAETRDRLAERTLSTVAWTAATQASRSSAVPTRAK